MKKVIAAVMAALMIAGCSPGMTSVRPVTDDGTNYRAFNEEGQSLLSKITGSDDLEGLPDGILSVGQEIPDMELRTYDGNSVNLKNFKGKPVVLELVAYWCDYCKEENSETLSKIIDSNSDITFVQAFVEGAKEDSVTDDDKNVVTKDTIKEFYTESGADMKNRTIVQESADLVSYASDTLRLAKFPSFIFYDESGKISYFSEGVLNEDEFARIRKYAFSTGEGGTDDRLYDHLDSALYQAADYDRDYEAVKADLSKDAQERLKSLPIDQKYGEAGFYSNVGRTIDVSSKMVDINDKVIDLSGKKGTTMYTFLSESDKNLEGEITVLNKYQKLMADSGVAFITVLITEASDSAKTMYRNLSEKPEGYVLDAKNDLPEALYNIVLFGAPQVLYVNEKDRICTGSYIGKFSIESLQKVYDAMNVTDPLYLVKAVKK